MRKLKFKETLRRYGKSVDDIFQLAMSARGVFYEADKNYTWWSFEQVEMDFAAIDSYLGNSRDIIIIFHDDSTLEGHREDGELKWTYKQ